MTMLWDLAERAGNGIGEILRRGRTLAGVEAAFAAMAGVFCLVAVTAATSGSVRTAWLVIGVVLCAIPAGAAILAWLALGRAKARTGIVGDLRRLVDDPAVRGDVARIGEVGGDRRRLLATGRRLWSLRTVVSVRRNELVDLWVSLLAITRLPLLAGISLVGALILGAVGVVAAIVAVLT